YQTNGASCSGSTCSSGVGSGTLAARPANCTTGVGYWATDQGSWNQSGNGKGNGVLYKCTSTNTWTSYYTPLAYPHPLQGGTQTASTPTFSPVAGTYSSAQSVSISTATTGCSSYIYWSTTDNPPTTGDTNGTSVTVASTETVYAKVIGCPGEADSSVGSAAYTLPATPCAGMC